MSTRKGRRWRRVLIVLLLLGAAVFYAFDPLLEHALHQVAARMEGSGHRIDFQDVDVNLIDGHVRIQGLTVEPMDAGDAADSTTRFHLRADDVDLDGVGIWKLLTDQVLHARSFIIHTPVMEHSFSTHKLKPGEKTPDEVRPEKEPGALPMVLIDSLVIENASGSSMDRAGIRPSVSIADIDLFLKDVSVEIGADNVPVLERSRTRFDVRGIAAELPPLYRFSIDSLSTRYPEVTTRVFGMELTSTVDPKEYYTLVETQKDLMGVHVDSLTLSGFNPIEQMRDGSYRANTVLLYGAVFEVHHDKSIPPGPRKYKPLPAPAILGMPITLAVDTLRAVHCEVRYSERMKRGDDYGTIAFTDIDGLLTGLSNAPDAAPADLHLHGTARIAGQGQAMLDLRMPMRADSADLTIHARVEDLPATMLNKMTDNLVNVNATDGHIHLLDLNVRADDVRANGTADMRYEDLHMELNESVEHSGLLSKVANMVVRSRNMPQDGNYRMGHFNVQRKQDSSVFNYLWLTIKAGCMDVVLPTSVKKGMKKFKKKKGGK